MHATWHKSSVLDDNDGQMQQLIFCGKLVPVIIIHAALLPPHNYLQIGINEEL